MNSFTIQCDDRLDFKFKGKRLGSVSSSHNITTGRWTELGLYRTTGGKYVCSEIGGSTWPDSPTTHRGAICETPEQVIEFFGYGVLAKELYEMAGIEAAVVVS